MASSLTLFNRSARGSSKSYVWLALLSKVWELCTEFNQQLLPLLFKPSFPSASATGSPPKLFLEARQRLPVTSPIILSSGLYKEVPFMLATLATMSHSIQEVTNIITSPTPEHYLYDVTTLSNGSSQRSG